MRSIGFESPEEPKKTENSKSADNTNEKNTPGEFQRKVQKIGAELVEFWLKAPSV